MFRNTTDDSTRCRPGGRKSAGNGAANLVSSRSARFAFHAPSSRNCCGQWQAALMGMGRGLAAAMATREQEEVTGGEFRWLETGTRRERGGKRTCNVAYPLLPVQFQHTECFYRLPRHRGQRDREGMNLSKPLN
ncbi:hypothetical protein BaRGS_00028329 [Batillaria attramentaria]|uniref:Uncharacterized protein n=1 Tax=Batillaria attramentaria TaxID=370345 RepID=A0ABD0JZ39_9CAEN